MAENPTIEREKLPAIPQQKTIEKKERDGIVSLVEVIDVST